MNLLNGGKASLFRMCIILKLFRVFEGFIIAVILLNSITLGMYDYADPDSLTFKNKIIDKISTALTAVYALEAILKIFALGFIKHHKSYLRENWNLIDFIVIISGYVSV